MLTSATQNRLVSEIVWIPTYIVVAALGSGFFGSGAFGIVATIATLIACRFVLEFLYRLVFGDSRLHWQVGAIAFASQMLLWGAIWAWIAKRGTA